MTKSPADPLLATIELLRKSFLPHCNFQPIKKPHILNSKSPANPLLATKELLRKSFLQHKKTTFAQ